MRLAVGEPEPSHVVLISDLFGLLREKGSLGR
jgi:hypothetical protein